MFYDVKLMDKKVFCEIFNILYIICVGKVINL